MKLNAHKHLPLLLFFFPIFTLSQTFSSGTNVTIPDAGSEVCSDVTVSGLTSTIDGTFGLETVCIKINHTYDGDLEIYLVAPDGTRIALSINNGSSGANYGSGTSNNSGTYCCFDMTAATSITSGSAPYQSSYTPEGDLGTANNGQNPNGTWSLCAKDDAGGDTGFINYWQLTFGNSPATPTGGGGSTHNIGSGNLTQCTGTVYDTGGPTGDYSSSESITETYCSDAGNCLSLTFNSFDTESGYDELSIYDGTTTSDPLIGTYDGTSLSGSTITSSSGCLTLEWYSDGSSTYAGWDADISCSACPTCTDGIQNGSEEGVDCGGTMCTACPCENFTIASLPYSNTGINTATYGNNYSSSDACGSYYMDGDDVVFMYTSSGNECLNITLSNTDATADVGLFFLDNCPSDPTANCLDYATQSNGAPSLGYTITSAGTYYIVVSTYPSPQSTNFDINITSTAVTSGLTCANAVNIGSIPFSQSGLNTSCHGNDYSSSDACGSFYMDGDDYVFKYTPAITQSVSINLNNTSTDVGLFVLDGCPSSGGTNCVASDEAVDGNPTICGVTLSAGTTYYIIVSSDGTPQSTPFDISIRSASTPTCNLSYTVSSISYNPASYSTGTSVSFGDDLFSPSWIDIGFDFCFDGLQYSRCLISSNGYILFVDGCNGSVPGGDATPNGYSPYTVDADIPNNNDAPMHAILGTWVDIDPSVSGNILYETTGTSPSRVFTVKFDNVAHFGSSCTSTTYNYTGQIKLYETTNNVEVHIGHQAYCTAWDDGRGIVGLHNYDGTIAVVPSGRNYNPRWNADNEAWRFVYGCPTCIVPLDIEFINFEGHENTNSVTLNWTTANSFDIKKFIVERSKDGKTFYPIGEIVNTNSNDFSSFDFEDHDPFSGNNYYRLIAIEQNEKLNYSSIIEITFFLDAIATKWYPNPTKDLLNIEIKSEHNKTINIGASSLDGKNIFTKQFKLTKGLNTIQYPTKELKSGSYIFTVRDKDKVIGHQLIIIE